MPQKPKENYKSDPNEINPKDFCQTPPYALTPLLPFIRGLKVWESASGNGAIVDVLRAEGFSVLATDLNMGPEFNYFTWAPEPDEYDAQVTNPPFGLKFKWMKRAYEIGKPWAMIMPTEVMGSSKALAMFEKYGVEIITLDSRVDYKMPNLGWDGAGSKFPSTWFTYGLNIGAPITYGKIAQEKKAFKKKLEAERIGQLSMEL